MTVKMQSLGTVGARPIWSLLLLIGLATAWFSSTALGQGNSWATILSGKWETNSNWSLGVAPNSSQTGTFITNAAGKTVTIDATTSGSSPGTLTISNLMVSAPIDSENTLLLTNVGLATPLRILNALTISSNATLLVYSNSMVQVLANVTSSGSLIIDGGGLVNVLNGGALIATNMITVIGNTGAGSMVVTAGTMRVNDLFMGFTPGSQGTLTLAGANAEIRDNWLVGYSVGSRAAVWMTGGQLTASNSFTIIGFSGPGQMTVSNGTMLGQAIYVGEDGGVGGTLTVAGGTIISGLGDFYGALTIGNNVGSTGAVWIVGGQLLATNSSPVPATTTVLVGNSGTAQMTLSNGVVNVGTINIAQSPGSAGTLTVAGGTLIANQLVASNAATIQFPAGVMTLGGAQIVNGQQFQVGGAGQTAVLNLVGGTNYFAGGLSPGFVSNSTGVAWLTGGQLNTTNAPSYVGWYGDGQMTVSNGTWLAYSAYVGYQTGSQGTLTIAGGTNIFSSLIDIAPQMNSTGTVWLTGGELVVTNFAVILAEGGVGQMIISNGTFLAGGLVFGDPNFALGTLTVAGGTTVLGGLGVNDGTQTVWLTGGQLTVNNTTTLGYAGIGRMTVSNGFWRSHNIIMGNVPGSQGTLTIAGGVSSVYSNVTIGSTNCTASSIVLITGGELHVTNDDAAAVLEVRSGTLIQTGGILDIDRIVVTNPCAHFIHMGGTLIYGLQTLTPGFDADGDGIPNSYEQANGLDPLDPSDASLDSDGDGMSNLQEYLAGTDPFDPNSVFRITAVTRQGADVRITWSTVGGKTNQVYLNPSSASGGLTDGIIPLGPQFIIPGTGESTTNYLDVGGATNKPSRYYRIKLVPPS